MNEMIAVREAARIAYCVSFQHKKVACFVLFSFFFCIQLCHYHEEIIIRLVRHAKLSLK